MTAGARRSFSPAAAVLLLTALSCFTALGHLNWLRADTSFAGYDERAFLDHLVKYRDVLRDKSPWHWFGWLRFSSYPAMPFLAGRTSGALGGYSLLAIRLSGVAFHLLWIVAVYLVGRRLAGRVAGLAAAGVIAVSPLATILARHYASFAVHAALSCVAVYAVIRLKDKPTVARTLAAGGTIALAILAERGTPLLYLAGPLLFAASGVWRETDRSSPHPPRRQVLIALVVGLGLAAPYLWGFVSSNLAHTIAQAQTPVNAGRPSYFYAARLLSFLTTEAPWPLLVVALVGALWRRDRRAWLPLFWFVIPFGVLSSLATRDMVYALSLTSPLAVLAGLSAAYLPARWWRVALLGALLFFALLAWNRAGDPQGRLARDTRSLGLFGLHNAGETPTAEPARTINESRLVRAAGELRAAPHDLWVVTGADADEARNMARADLGDALRLVLELHGVEGRFLLMRQNAFPGRLPAKDEDQHLVLVSRDVLTPGGPADFLARPAFDPREHARLEPAVVEQFRTLQLEPVRTVGLDAARLTLWRASRP
jgi:4-amino-4-deoxy-L-arabinose transferase-like glycosyltransferase